MRVPCEPQPEYQGIPAASPGFECRGTLQSAAFVRHLALHGDSFAGTCRGPGVEQGRRCVGVWVVQPPGATQYRRSNIFPWGGGHHGRCTAWDSGRGMARVCICVRGQTDGRSNEGIPGFPDARRTVCTDAAASARRCHPGAVGHAGARSMGSARQPPPARSTGKAPPPCGKPPMLKGQALPIQVDTGRLTTRIPITAAVRARANVLAEARTAAFQQGARGARWKWWGR